MKDVVKKIDFIDNTYNESHIQNIETVNKQSLTNIGSKSRFEVQIIKKKPPQKNSILLSCN